MPICGDGSVLVAAVRLLSDWKTTMHSVALLLCLLPLVAAKGPITTPDGKSNEDGTDESWKDLPWPTDGTPPAQNPKPSTPPQSPKTPQPTSKSPASPSDLRAGLADLRDDQQSLRDDLLTTSRLAWDVEGKKGKKLRKKCGCRGKKKIVELPLSQVDVVEIKPYQKDSKGNKRTNYQRYIGRINIGTPPQEIDVAFATTFNSLWLPATGCKANTRMCKGKVKNSTYDVKKSKSAVSKKIRNFGELYLDQYVGSALGKTHADKLELVRTDGQKLSFKCPLQFSALDNFDHGDYGVLGLGRAGDFTAPPRPRVMSKSPQAVLADQTSMSAVAEIFRLTAQPVVQIYLKDCSNVKCPPKQAGLITMGGVSDKFCNPPKLALPVARKGWPAWNVKLSQVKLGKVARQNVTIAFSSYLPDIVMGRLWANRFAAEAGATRQGDDYIIPCDKKVEIDLKLPNGDELTIRDHRIKEKLPSGECRLRIDGNQSRLGVDYWLMGYPLMRSFCWTFDFKKQTVTPSRIIDPANDFPVPAAGAPAPGTG